MISVVILGVGLSAVANSYILASRGASAAANKVSALILAKEKFDNFKFASLKGASVGQSLPLTVKFSSKDYRYQEEISEIAEAQDLAKNLVLATATVSWSERNSPKNVTLVSYFPKQK
jgi:Tfp pilus assembly protein PilV